MKMIPLTQFIEVIKKQGAVGVLALWLTYTHFEVQDVKERLYNCLDKNEYYNRKPIEEKQPPLPSVKNDTVAVIDNKNRKLAKK
jgi:hypothetical protein